MSLPKGNLSKIMPDFQADQQSDRRVNWEYEDDPYQDSSLAIKTAQEGFIRKDLRFIEMNTTSKPVTNKAIAMYQFANELTFDRNKSGEQTIYENWPMEYEKYIEFDSESENSEDNQVEVDFPCCDDIMAIIDTEKQEGKICFLLKAQLPKNQDFSIAIQRVKGGGRDVQIIELLDRKDCYYLYKISMTSQIRIFKIVLLMNGNKVLQSKPYNFSVDRMEYDVGLSYDFVEGEKLPMSNFEGLVAASCFNIADHVDYFEKSMNTFEDKNKIFLEGQIEFDSIFDKFILGHKNSQKFLLLFQAILKSPQDDNEKLKFYKHPVIQKVANYFMKFMVNYDLKVDEDKKITLNKALRMIESYLEILSVQKIAGEKSRLINDSNLKQVEMKVSLYLEFLIQNRRFDIVTNYMNIQIQKKFRIIHLHKGLGSFIDLIQQSIEAYDETYSDIIVMFVYYYMDCKQMTPIQLIQALVKSFGDKKYQWTVLDENERFPYDLQNNQRVEKQETIAFFEEQIVTKIQIPPKNYDLFEKLYKLTMENKQHQYLSVLFRSQIMVQRLDEFIDCMVNEIPDISELPLLQKGIKILVDVFSYDSEKYLRKCPNKLVILINRLLRYSNNSVNKIDIKKRCQIVHKLVMNPLMKSGSNEKIQTIKTICGDFSSIVNMKFNKVTEINDLINQCFEPSFISNILIQNIYIDNILKVVYRLHFTTQNALNIEKCKGQFNNWHNDFNNKPFLNSFIVEQVAKLLCASKKFNRDKTIVINNLKQMIDRGLCPSQEKQNLRSLVELDNFELNEGVFHEILTKNRDKLFILQKIKKEGDGQKFILQSLITEFKRKFENNEYPAKTYLDINSANQLHKNMIESVFGPYEVIDTIQEKTHLVTECFEKLAKFRNFLECLKKKYTLTDYQQIFSELKQSEELVRQTKLLHIQEILVYLNKVDEKILMCYSFSSFFSGENLSNISFAQAIKRCQSLQKRIIEKRDQVVKEYETNQLTYQSINFFKEQLSRQKQLFDLFMMSVSENQQSVADASIVKQLLKIFSLLKKIPDIINYIKGLSFYLQIDESGKFKELSKSLSTFYEYLLQISNQIPTTNISKLYHQEQKANKLIGCLRFSRSSPECLNFEDKKSTQLLQFLYRMSLISEGDINKLVLIKPEISNMKEKCDEDEQEYLVNFEDLQKAELLINYIQNIYNPEKRNIKSLISSTIKLMNSNSHSRLKLSYMVFQKLQPLTTEFQNVHQGDKKMADRIKEILHECIVQLRFNDKNQFFISLIQSQQNQNAEMKMQQQKKRKVLSEDDIKKYNNEAVNYIIQNNEKVKTKYEVQKIHNYQSFIGLLKCINQIKLIWHQLQEWGYILFKKDSLEKDNKDPQLNQTESSQFEEDRQIYIFNNNHKNLTDYVDQKKKTCQQWITHVKELHLISPKTTLLQGQSFMSLYEILTGSNFDKIPDFLNICEPQQLKGFLLQTKIKFEKDQIKAINLIKDFFNYLAKLRNKVELQEPSLKDYSECYIKEALLNEKQKDFINGIMELDPVRVRNIDITKILTCVQTTTLLDVKSFIETALRDQKNQYVIMRPQKLSNKNQQYIIKQIKEHQKQNKKITLKLCLVTNSTIQSLYQYLKTFPKKTSEKSKQVREKAFSSFIDQITENVKIVKSRCPGFGKTSFIIEDSQKDQRACFFLPISGAPTSKSIYERFEKITREIYLRKQNDKKQSSLVVQIHNVDPNSFEIVNTFLQQIITGRSVRYDGKFPKMIRNTKIYIEIENIQSVNTYDPLKTFTFLNELLLRKGNVLIKEIKERPPINFDKFGRKKTQFIVQHLELLDKNLLDVDQGEEKNMKTFEDFKKIDSNVDQKRARELMQKYFFSSIKEATFYQYQYFCGLMFEGCQAYTSSYGLSFQNIKQSYDKFYKIILCLDTMRTEFFKVFLKNCIEFIGRVVDYSEFNFQNRKTTQQKLSSIPLLIIPNTDGYSFSFIYKDPKSVPTAIRNFYISQSTELIGRIGKGSQQTLAKLFEEHSLQTLQQKDPKKFDQKIRQTLLNISGNKEYSIFKDPNYVVNIDNFIKMCLITLRERQNIPIVIMGQAGTGKTALLKHVSQKLYESQFMTLNINAGTKVEDMRVFLERVKQRHTQLKEIGGKKIWVFFDEFNTVKEVGYIKQIMIDRKFEGRRLDFLSDVVMMAACNPFRKLISENKNQRQISMIQDNAEAQSENQDGALAFHVLPPPHSMIESMWNYGALSATEYKKYIERMILSVGYKTKQATDLLIQIHDYLSKKFDSSFVSLRDIERFRTIYQFFVQKLPRNPHQKSKVYNGYNNKQERALILSFFFCYFLRIESSQMKDYLYKMIENKLGLNQGHVKMVKEFEQEDFFNRLRIDYSSIAANSAIKENTYAFFVAIYNRLPMIIVGPPGCSKSLSIRILTENLKGANSEDKYLSEFKAMRALNFQGSELCTSKQVEKLFQRAKNPNKKKQKPIAINNNSNEVSLVVIVFDEIGLADKSKDNPLKVIHPYLEVSKDLNLDKNDLNQRNYSFLAISNTNLDISKMSRMLVLRRPQPSTKELKETAIGISKSFEYGRNEKISIMIENMSEAFFKFIDQWHQQKRFRNFYSLRDFYSLIKHFLGACQERQVNINDDRELSSLFELSVFKNINGMKDSVELFMKQYRMKTGEVAAEQQLDSKFDVVENVLKSLQKQNLRFPLVIAEDQQSLSYLINMLMSRFKNKTSYFESSPFPSDKNNNLHVLQTTASIIKTLGKGDKLILNNIEPTIQTSLYDMLNKFYIVRGQQNYCRISEVQSGLTKKTLVNKEFNCIFFLIQSNLQTVEAPFLSRFEKYSFNLNKIPNSKLVQNLTKQVEYFKTDIGVICKAKNLAHYKIENFFQNCQKNIIRTLILKTCNEVNTPALKIESESMIHEEEQNPHNLSRLILDQVIYDMVMNCTQDFIMIYHYILSKQPQMNKYARSIVKAIEKKKIFSIDGSNNIILFTTDKSIVYNGCNEPTKINKLQLEVIKKQSSFGQYLLEYLNAPQEDYLFIEIKANHLEYIQYLISEIQKIKQQESVSKAKSFDHKKIFLLHELDRKEDKKDKYANLGNKNNGISFLCDYPQIFYEGKLQIGMIKYDRKEFFTNVIDLSHILEHIQDFFVVDFKCKNDDNKAQLLKSFRTLYNQLQNDKNNILHRHIEEFIEKTEGTNVTINEALIREVLQNAQFLKNSKNFKQALTRQLSNKSFYGVVAYFLKYLFQNESFLTYSNQNIHNFNSIENFAVLNSRKQLIEHTKKNSVYDSNLKFMISKKIDFLKNQYKKTKLIRRLPSSQRKFPVQIERGRLIHFSKAQNQIILNKDSGSLSELANKISIKSTNLEKDFKIFKQQLHKKSTFVIKNDTQAQKSEQNLYSSMNKDQNMKELFVFELLMDLVEKKGINIKHIDLYMKILKQFISFDASNNQKTLDTQHYIFAILIYEQVLTFIFKLFSVFFDNEILLTPINTFYNAHRIREIKDVTQENCSRFIHNIVKEFLDPLFMDVNSIKKLNGAKNFYNIFTNCMLQIENIEKILKKNVKDQQKKDTVSANLISLKDMARFCSEFSEEHKFQLLEMYIQNNFEKKHENNAYSVTFNFVEGLNKNDLSPSQTQIIMKFQANKIFQHWFRDRPDDINCLRFFIKKCEEDQHFCHNSMHVINYLLNSKQYEFKSIEDVQEVMKSPGNELVQIAKYSKANNFQNNLCILLVNIFLQKLQQCNHGKSHQQILQEHKNNFISYFKKLSLNNLESQFFQIYLFAFVKFVLISYTQLFLSEHFDNDISELLNGEDYLASNSRLFCLKLLRKHFTPKQIKQKFISIQRMHWGKKVQIDFKENQARSLIVPKDYCSVQLSQILNEIEKSDGSLFILFEKILDHAQGFQNRYSILNFFMRFYFTFLYNQKAYKVLTLQFFASIRAKFVEKLGKIQTQLIERYLKNEVSPHFFCISSQTANQEDLIPLNFINLFLASKNSISPLHSLFYKDGQLQSNIYDLTKDQFVISGPQNPFINIAQSVIQLNRNNNIGVYICCNDCDYIYSHQNCGWPREQANCPMCGEKIGSKDGGHILSRNDQGARRLISKAFLDRSAFYVYNMANLPEYWQVQRKYIEAEINRMKTKKQATINIKKEVLKLTGMNIVNSGRVSSFTYRILTLFIDAIAYMLVSFKVISSEEIDKLFGLKSQQLALNNFHTSIKQTLSQAKSSLNLGNKFNGWMYGIQRSYILDMNNFKTNFTNHQITILEEMNKLKQKLNIQIQQKKIKQDYINLYIDFVKTIQQGYFVKEQCSINDMTGSNRFTRDFSQKLLENLVKVYTGEQKFQFSLKFQTTQGKMQFPFDTFLTEDQINAETYNYYRIFKLPDQQISHQQIAIKYEAIIKENYPYLDYVLKNSDLFYQMKNFFKLVSFVNELHKQVNNRYERSKAQESLKSFIQQLRNEQGNSLNKKLQNPEQIIKSWKKLSKFLGVLQNECKFIGKMNDDYDLTTPLKAFLLDQSTKQNTYGLMIASIFHNFAKMHNESMAILNSKKNQIKAYSSLNLFNDLLKLHPQEIQFQQIFTLDQDELKQNLESCSVASIIYGQNFIFHNFDAYQQYFLRKLQGKCEIISNLKEFFNVCYNGEAFSAQTEGSAVLAEIRQVLDRKLSEQSSRIVKQFIKKAKSSQSFEKSIVQVRGDLEKIMLMLNTLKGNYSKDQSCIQIINEVSIPVNSMEIKRQQLSQIPVCEIYHLYELLEEELKHLILKRLPEKYKAKMENQMATKVEDFLKGLPREDNEQQPTIDQLESAVMKFTSRTLQNGIFDAEKNLVQFVVNRADFWPKGYSDNKTDSLTYDPTMCSIQICHVMALLEIIAKVKTSN